MIRLLRWRRATQVKDTRGHAVQPALATQQDEYANVAPGKAWRDPVKTFRIPR